MTPEQATAFLRATGGARETRAPVAYFENDLEDGGNILSCFAADGSYLCDIAWRPWNPALAPTYLFLC